MALDSEPECSTCKTKQSETWHKGLNNREICASCQEDININILVDKRTIENESNLIMDDKKEIDIPKLSKEDEEMENDKDKDLGKCSDKKESKRKTRKGKQTGKANFLKGKGRRIIFKKSATKAPVAISTPTTSEFVFHNGIYYQVGDIVSVIDIDGGTFYAQIRGLLQDQYCEKSAALSWLLPTKNSPSPEKCFDPSTYIIGPDEDIPRKLDFLSYVCHAPSDYYKDRYSPYATASHHPNSCFIWSKLGPIIKPIEQSSEVTS